MLVNNMRVYSPISSDTACIRVVCLSLGRGKEDIVCELVTGALAELEFDALSYVWGVTLTPYKINVDRKPFFVSYNLYTAPQ
jgi:hypothetical protein